MVLLVLSKIKNLCVVVLALIISVQYGAVNVEWINGDIKTEWFEVVLDWKQGDLKIMQTIPMPQTEAIIPRPRSGRFEVLIRACMLDETGSDLCSEWIQSGIHGAPEPWLILWNPGIVDNIIIEDE